MHLQYNLKKKLSLFSKSQLFSSFEKYSLFLYGNLMSVKGFGKCWQSPSQDHCSFWVRYSKFGNIYWKASVYATVDMNVYNPHPPIDL